jgi:hypothetical protein
MSESTDLASLESAVLQAIVDHRWDSLSNFLDEDFAITTAGWLEGPAGKAKWVHDVQTRHELHEFAIESIEERSFQDVRVALVLSKQIVTWQGARQAFRFRYTDVWRRDDARWLLWVRHASLVPTSRERVPAPRRSVQGRKSSGTRSSLAA